MPEANDVIALTLPRDPRFFHVARLVVGGLGARLDLAFEALDDLQLAVETVLSQDGWLTGEEVEVELEVAERAIDVVLGPVDADGLRAALEAEPEGELALGTLLAAVVDEVSFEPRGEEVFLRLVKRATVAAKS